MDSNRITDIVEKYRFKPFRKKQLTQAFFGDFSEHISDVTTLSKGDRDRLKGESVLAININEVYASEDGRCYKALVGLSDGKFVETVLMAPRPDYWTTCISSQAGCALACSFCATGKLGLLRNLKAEEITDQVLFWLQFIKKHDLNIKLRNVVYMGMGEPFQNRRQVYASLQELMNPDTFGFGARHLSVSTAGLVKPIYEMAEQFPQVNLALSLHAANDELREKLMPINKSYNLEDLAKALSDYMAKTNRKVFVEYILLENENDTPEHAKELATYLKSIKPFKLLHVNLIVYNPTDSVHAQSPKDVARRFLYVLEKNGVSATIRKNLGRDIDGACGQLAGKVHPERVIKS